MRLHLVSDDQESFAKFLAESLWEEWGVDLSEITQTNSLNGPAGLTLFGDTPPVQLKIDKNTNIPALTEGLEGIGKSGLETAYASGLILVSGGVGVQKLKKLEKAVKGLGGTSQIKTKSAASKENANELLSLLSLNSESRNFLKDYVGEDYTTLLPLVRSISKLPKAQQRKITVEMLTDRIPQPPGAVPPWEMEKPFYKGDKSEVIRIAHRVIQGTPSRVLLVMWFFRTKISDLARVSSVLAQDPKISTEDLSNATGVKGYPLTLARNRAKSLSNSKILEMTELVLEYDRLIRGGSSMNGIVLVEILIVELMNKLQE